jgi:SAM-dependent methyltransferase
MALGLVESIYSRLLPPGSKILDLMSSWVSHLPDTLEDDEATGLGLNEEELKANPQLSSHIVHDLNRDPVLPFADNEFDAVICTASIEYLTQPIEVVAEVARVTKPGGAFVNTFSDRWFPGKEILPWPELHPFERLGLVLDYCRKADRFESLYTESARGLPRPADDRHIEERAISDPIFAVWGSVEN